MEETWKDIEGYEGIYQISNLGRVKSVDRDIYDSNGIKRSHRYEKLKHISLDGCGYSIVSLSKDGKVKKKRVHRLVAEAFIPNPNNLPEVNHIDTIRTNSRVDNLEWCTRRENIDHSIRLGHYKRYGSRNSNYGGTKLKEYYKEHPEEKAKLARKGKQNGMCKPVAMYDLNDNLVREFDYIRECAKWFKDNYNIKYTVPTIHQQILRSIDNNKEYYGYKFKI